MRRSKDMPMDDPKKKSPRAVPIPELPVEEALGTLEPMAFFDGAMPTPRIGVVAAMLQYLKANLKS
jgi:hypothetical protein